MKPQRKVDRITIDRRNDLTGKPWQIVSEGRRTTEVHLIDHKDDLPKALKVALARLRD